MPPKEVISPEERQSCITPSASYCTGQSKWSKGHKALTHEVTPDIYTVRGCMAEIGKCLKKDGE